MTEEVKSEIEEPKRSQEPLQAADDPMETSAMVLRTFAPVLKEAVKSLSTGQLRRLVVAMCSYPLENDQILGQDKQLWEVYNLSERVLGAKTTLIQLTLMERIEEAQELEKQKEEKKENGEN